MTAAVAAPVRTQRTGLFWLAWRQHRAVMAFTALWAALLGGVALGVAGALSRLRAAGCDEIGVCAAGDRAQARTLVHVGEVVVPLAASFPVLVAVFWAAPMVAREYEQRTHLLTWAQDISPRRWLLWQVAVTGAAAVALAGLLGLASASLVTEMSAINPTGNTSFEPGNFDAAPVVLAIHTVVGLALGLAVSTAVRRIVAAMGIVLAATAAVWTALVVARPMLVTATEVTVPSQRFGDPQPAELAGAWVWDQQPVGADMRYSYVGIDRLGELQLWDCAAGAVIVAVAGVTLWYRLARRRTMP